MAEDKKTPEKDETAEAEPPKPELMSFKDFLENVPASQFIEVRGVWIRQKIHSHLINQVASPTIELHCTNEACNGVRFFRLDSYPKTLDEDGWVEFFIDYRCSNCNVEVKRYSLAIRYDLMKQDNTPCYKFGEMPAFGPPIPSRLIKLIGPDKDMFLKGRQSENHGLGIGAFSYYRRVVENQKDRILDAIIKAAEKLSAPEGMIVTLKAAKEEQQFKKALESVKDAVPPGLLINGQNPLTLLHAALSDGLHGKSDEECLQRAHDIRLVLGELSERLAQAVKDEKELSAALGRLTRKK